MKKLLALTALVFATATAHAILVQWDADLSSLDPVTIEAYHGEDLRLQPNVYNGRQSVYLGYYTAKMYWQTPDMEDVYYVTNVTIRGTTTASTDTTWTMSAYFSREMDPGVDTVRCFIQLKSTQSDTLDDINYRIAFSIRFHGSPGRNPEIVQMPTRKLDYDLVEVYNAPYYTKQEASTIIDARISTAFTNWKRSREYYEIKYISSPTNGSWYLGYNSPRATPHPTYTNRWQSADARQSCGIGTDGKFWFLNYDGWSNIRFTEWRPDMNSYTNGPVTFNYNNGYNVSYSVTYYPDEELVPALLASTNDVRVAKEEAIAAATNALMENYDNRATVEAKITAATNGFLKTAQVEDIVVTQLAGMESEAGALAKIAAATNALMENFAGGCNVIHYDRDTGEFTETAAKIAEYAAGDQPLFCLVDEYLWFGLTMKHTETVEGVTTWQLSFACHNASNAEAGIYKPWILSAIVAPSMSYALANVGSASYLAESFVSLTNSAAFRQAVGAFAYPKEQGEAWSTYWDGDEVRVTITNYYGNLDLPHFYLEQRTNTTGTAKYKTVWDELTRWRKFVGGDFDWTNWAGFETNRTNTNARLASLEANKADRAWGFYDSHAGTYAPANYTSISSSNVMLSAGLAYQRTVVAGGSAIWVLTATEPTTATGTSNGAFQIKDADGNVQVEIVKGDKRTVGAGCGGVSVSGTTLVAEYAVASGEHPTLEVCVDLEEADWKAEDAAGCPATVSWSGSSGAWVASVTPTSASQVFVKASYQAGGDSMFHSNVAMKFTQLVIGTTTYNIGTASVSGNTVLTLTPAP